MAITTVVLELYECHVCGREEHGHTVETLTNMVFEAFPIGWMVHIHTDGDYDLVCDHCISGNQLSLKQHTVL